MPLHLAQPGQATIPGLEPRRSIFQGVPGFSDHVNSILGGLGIPRRATTGLEAQTTSLRFPEGVGRGGGEFGSLFTGQDAPGSEGVAKERTAGEKLGGNLPGFGGGPNDSGEDPRSPVAFINVMIELGKQDEQARQATGINVLMERIRGREVQSAGAKAQSGEGRPSAASPNPNLQDLTLAALSRQLQVTPRNFLGRRTA